MAEMLAPDHNDETLVADGDVVKMSLAKFRSSPLPEHQHLCAVAAAMVEVIGEQGLEVTPTAYFAAVMAALERDQTDDSDAVVGAMLSLLAIVLPKTPQGVLRAKMDQVLAVMVRLVGRPDVDGAKAAGGTVKPGLLCLQHLLQAADKTSWPPLARPFGILLHHCTDSRPKIRKRAQGALVEVLAEMQGTSSLAMASNAITALCDRIMAAALAPVGGAWTDSSAEGAAGVSKKGKKRGGAEEAGAGTEAKAAAVAVLHLLGSLQTALPLLGEGAITKVLLRLAELHALRQPLLTRHVVDTLQALCRSPTAVVAGRPLGEALTRIAAQEAAHGGAVQGREAGEVRAVAQALQQGLEKLHDVDPGECGRRLPAIFHTLIANLSSEQEEVVFGTAEALRAIIGTCVDEALVQAGLDAVQARAAEPGGAPSAIERVCAAMESTLSYQFATAWDISLLLVAALLDKLGPAAAVLMESTIRTLGELQELPDSDMRCRKQLHAAVGAAVAAVGPAQLLQILPLQMDGPDLAQSRVWLLPVLRQHCVGASLAFFGDQILPLAARLRERSRQAASEGRPVAAKNAEACVTAVWALLPSVCHLSSNVARAFPMVAKALGDALAREESLRGVICTALQTLVRENRAAAGHATQPALATGRQEEPSLAEERARAALTPEVAAANLAAVAAFSKNFLPLLFNAFVAAPTEKRDPLQATISEFAAITDPNGVKSSFVTVMKKLLQATKDAGGTAKASSGMQTDDGATSAATASAKRCTFMDLALAMVAGLDSESLSMLYTTAKPALQDGDSAVQKRAYKLVGRLCQFREGFVEHNAEDLLDQLLVAMGACHSAARRHRLICLHHVIMHLLKTADDRREEAVATLLSEIILATKEANKKTRDEAYSLLVAVARSVEDPDTGGSHAALLRFFTMVVGGLAGATPHMVSATVVALARLLYEFSAALIHTIPELLPSALLLLRSKSREIVKSVLGLVKVVIARVPGGELEPHLGALLEGILQWCADSKNHFKMKVRVILERLVRRCGMAAVAAAMPPEHAKLLTHIRKAKEKELRKKRGGTSEVADDDNKTARTRVSTARGSTWNHTDVFSDEDDVSDGLSGGDDASTQATTAAGRSFARTKGMSASSARSMRNRKMNTRLPEDDNEGDGSGGAGEPLDLLDLERTRRVLSAPIRAKHNRKKDDEDNEDIPEGPDGRLLITKDDGAGRRKRARDDDQEEEGGDDEDWQSQGGNSQGGASKGGRSRESGRQGTGGSRALQKRQSTVKKGRGFAYTGEEYAAKKGRVAGDAARPGKLEPHAYWPLDPKMMNRREGKRAAARKGMKSVLHTSGRKEGGGTGKRPLRAVGGVTKKKRIAQKLHKGKR